MMVWVDAKEDFGSVVPLTVSPEISPAGIVSQWMIKGQMS